MSKVDNNHRYVALAGDGSGNPLPLKVDAATGRLLVHIQLVDEPTGESLHTATSVDKNHKNVAFANDGSGNTIPLHIDSRNGRLFCDVNIE